MLLTPIRARGIRHVLACERDLEGILAKWARGTYQCDGRGTSRLKIENPEYSQAEGRHELFDAKCSVEWRTARKKVAAPTLALL
jgi:hypothetical protein